MINIRNGKEYIENFLYIRTKESELVKFKMNEPQRRLYDTMAELRRKRQPIRIIILKARQMGFSTLTEGLLFWATANGENTDSMIVAHVEEATHNLYRMSQTFYECLPEELKPARRTSNAQEIVFDTREGTGLKSRIRCATAGGSGIGRSYTLKNLHMSEFAFWPGNKLETYTGLMQAVPDEADTMVIIESTANGYNEFKDMWDAAVAGESGFTPVFFPWFEMKEYSRAVPEGFRLTEEEKKLKETYALTDGQLAWRRWCIQTNCAGDINMFRQEYPATPDEAFIATGQCVFDKEKIILRREEVKGAKWEKGIFRFDYDGTHVTDIRWEEDENGPIRIHTRPVAGHPYVIGGDTAGTGSDKFTGQVLDNSTGEQAAVLSHQFDEGFYARQMYCLGIWYNTALIGVETNYSTYPVKELERLGYPKLYVRERVDTYTGKTMQTYGFNTTSVTRPLIIDGLKEIVRRDIELIGDWETLGEMLTFVYDEKWKGQAEAGKHDDLVMALAIAHHIRSQQTREVEIEEEQAQWSESMWEDWRAAGKEEREYLMKKWGKPK